MPRKDGYNIHLKCSLTSFLPKTCEFLIEKSINIISARSIYEDQFPLDPFQWKLEAFLEISKDYNNENLTNIICIGDNDFEMSASNNLANSFDLNLLKKIKLCKEPSINELIKQLKLINKKYFEIFNSGTDKFFKLEKKS